MRTLRGRETWLGHGLVWGEALGEPMEEGRARVLGGRWGSVAGGRC